MIWIYGFKWPKFAAVTVTAGSDNPYLYSVEIWQLTEFVTYTAGVRYSYFEYCKIADVYSDKTAQALVAKLNDYTGEQD